MLKPRRLETTANALADVLRINKGIEQSQVVFAILNYVFPGKNRTLTIEIKNNRL